MTNDIRKSDFFTIVVTRNFGKRIKAVKKSDSRIIYRPVTFIIVHKIDTANYYRDIRKKWQGGINLLAFVKN